MSGTTSTQQRPIKGLGPFSYSEGLLGTPGDHRDPWTYVPDGVQKTTSYRTVHGSAAEQVELEEDMRIFRNGFTTNDPVYDRGHEFFTSKTSCRASGPMEVYLLNNYYGYDTWYRGPLLPRLSYDMAFPGYPNAAQPSDSEIIGLGQRALEQCAPTAPQANAATFIGEMFASLPQMVGASLWKTRLTDYRAIGSEHLNIQFGWLPFLGDLKKIATSLSRSTAILRQLQRDNGRVVRRRFRFPPVTSVSETSFQGMYGNPYWRLDGAVHLRSPYPDVVVWDRSERTSWFSGAFSYCIPTDSDLWSKIEKYDAMTNVLLGTRVTPETVWQLAPWSWLVDWKFSIGQALSLATRFSEDGLVIRYGYLMNHQVREMEYSVPPALMKNGKTLPATFTTLRSESKARYRATPYGFGTSIDGLSDQQWAILGLLGLAKGPNAELIPRITGKQKLRGLI